MKASTKRMTSILFAAMLLIGAVMVYSMFITPAYEQISAKRNTMVSKRQVVENQRLYVQDVRTLLSEYREAVEDQKKLSGVLPGEEAIPEALFQIVSIAQLNSMMLLSVSPSRLALQANQQSLLRDLGTVRFTLRLSGSYDNFKKFVRNVETNLRLMNVVNARVSPDLDDQNAFQFDIIVDSYYHTE